MGCGIGDVVGGAIGDIVGCGIGDVVGGVLVTLWAVVLEMLLEGYW